MKKFYTIILTAALAVTLCGCSNGGESGNVGNDGADNIPNVSRGDEEFERYIKTIPDVDIPMPDGSTRRRGDIDRLNKSGLITFDVAYIRSPKMRFESTFDDPEVFDKENFEFRGEIGEIGEIEWVPVKAGDVLENGLVVESAFTTPDYAYPFENDTIDFYEINTTLSFSGEFELEGILRYYPGSENYGYTDSSVTFIPDCTKFVLPIPYPNGQREYSTMVDTESGNALIYDGAEFNFGSVEDSGFDFGSDMPTLSKARMTLKNISSRPGGYYTAEILECTVLDK